MKLLDTSKNENCAYKAFQAWLQRTKEPQTPNLCDFHKSLTHGHPRFTMLHAYLPFFHQLLFIFDFFLIFLVFIEN